MKIRPIEVVIFDEDRQTAIANLILFGKVWSAWYNSLPTY